MLNFNVYACLRIFRKDPSARPSTTELLAEPFIAEHIKNMIKRFEQSSLDQLESTVVVKNDRSEIAKALLVLSF
jgi:hypothetical protein